MSAPAETPRARGKPPRTLAYNAAAGALFITVGGEEFGYWVDRLPAGGGRGFRLTKFVANRKPGEPDHYDVFLAADGTSHTCECKGHLRWARCKHVDALAVLAGGGRLA